MKKHQRYLVYCIVNALSFLVNVWAASIRNGKGMFYYNVVVGIITLLMAVINFQLARRYFEVNQRNKMIEKFLAEEETIKAE